jgi:RimJ/RimL family protein N-acetyltransferase
VVWFADHEGLVVGLRPIHPDDKPALLEGFERLSDESRYQRFLSPVDRLTSGEVRYLTEIDHVNHFAWAAGIRRGDGEEIGVGVGRYVRDGDDPSSAEMSVVVADDYQGRGIGTLLTHALLAVAWDRDIEFVTGCLFEDNAPMLRILERLGATVSRDAPAILRGRLRLPPSSFLFDDEGGNELVWVANVAAHPSHRPGR